MISRSSNVSHWMYFWVFVAMQTVIVLLLQAMSFWWAVHFQFGDVLRAQLMIAGIGAAVTVLYYVFRLQDKMWLKLFGPSERL